MKIKITILALFIILLCSCSGSYVQVFETSSENEKIKNESNYVYENDSVKLLTVFGKIKVK